MADSPTVIAFLERYTILFSRLRELSHGEDKAAGQAAALALFSLPADDSALPRPGEASGASPKELCAIAEAAGLPFSRDVAHGRLHRHPVASTWIVSFSCSPGDVRVSQNAIQDLRKGYRDARDTVFEVLDALRQIPLDAPLGVGVPEGEAVIAIEQAVQEKGLDVAAAAYLYERSPTIIRRGREYQKAIADAATNCCDMGTCTCESCVAARALKKLIGFPCTPFGWTTFMAALRRVNRHYESMGPKAILIAAGITDPTTYEGIIQRLHYGNRGEWTKVMPEVVATKVTAWFEATRTKNQEEKAAKQAPKENTPQSRARDLLARQPLAPDPARTTTFLAAVNAFRKEQDSIVECLQAELRATRTLLTDLLAASADADPQKLKDLQEDLQEAQEQLKDAREQAEASQKAVADEKTAQQAKFGALLVALNTKVENVRAMRLAEDLNAISEAILAGAVELGIDLPVAQPAS